MVAWLSLFRRGNLGMTQPMLLGFLHEDLRPKIFFRVMLYATGKRGHIVEAIYLTVQRAGSTHIFNFWMYGETKDLKIGSGLRVGEEGVSYNHHFLPPRDDSSFTFAAGEYVIDVHARILNRSAPVHLSSVKVSLAPELAGALLDLRKGVLFTWRPDSQTYRAEVSEPLSSGYARSVSGAGTARLPWA